MMRNKLILIALNKLILIALCFILQACVRQSAVHASMSGFRWRADEISPNKYLITALDHEAAREAQADICDQGKYICSIQPLQSFVIERTHK